MPRWWWWQHADSIDENLTAKIPTFLVCACGDSQKPIACSDVVCLPVQQSCTTWSALDRMFFRIDGFVPDGFVPRTSSLATTWMMKKIITKNKYLWIHPSNVSTFAGELPRHNWKDCCWFLYGCEHIVHVSYKCSIVIINANPDGVKCSTWTLFGYLYSGSCAM